VRSFAIDYVARQLVASVDVCVGNPDDPIDSVRERRRAGTLTISGLVLWAMEPSLISSNSLWLTDDGPLHECPTEAAKALAAQCSTCGVAWYFFFGDLNAFGYVAGAQATFKWD